MKKLLSLFLLTFIFGFAFSAFGRVQADPPAPSITHGDTTTAPETAADYTGTDGTITIDLWVVNQLGELTVIMSCLNGYTVSYNLKDDLDNVLDNAFLAGSFGDTRYINTSNLIVGSEYSIYVYCQDDAGEDQTGIQTSLYEVLELPYTITYNLDGGANHIDNPATFVVGDLPITLEDPTPPDGYIFVAWHDSVALDNPITTITLEDDIELWAEYASLVQPQQNTFDFDYAGELGHHYFSLKWPSHIIEGNKLPVTVTFLDSTQPKVSLYPYFSVVHFDRNFTGNTDLSWAQLDGGTSYTLITASGSEPKPATGDSFTFYVNTDQFTIGEYSVLFYGVKVRRDGSYSDGIRGMDLPLDFKVVETFDIETEDLGVFFVDIDDPVSLAEIKSEITVLDYNDNDISDSLIVLYDEYSLSDKTLGDYDIIFYADDEYDNRTYAAVTVRVVDITGPVITLTGDSTVYVEFGTNYTDPGATATDNTDPDPTLVITGTVNVGVLGSYTRTYTATDVYGNETIETRTVIVQDTTPPVITFEETYESNTESAYELSHFLSTITAYDTHDGDLTASITIVTNNYTGNETTPGTYSVTISVEDASGNSTVETFSITVVNYIPPTITASDYLVSNEVADAMTHEQIIAHIASRQN